MGMSGIDSQLAASRTMELSKDLSNISRKDELMQDYASLQRKTDEEMESKSVSAIERKEEARITREKHGSSQDQHQNEGKKKSGTAEEEDSEEDQKETAGRGRIDIRV
jgi:hypothetical protein